MLCSGSVYKFLIVFWKLQQLPNMRIPTYCYAIILIFTYLCAR